MNLYAILIDLLLLLIIGIAVYFSARRGFVRTVVETVGFLAAAIVALTVCTPLASVTYDKMIEPSVLKVAEREVNASLGDVLQEIPDISDKSDEIDKLKSKFNDSLNEIVDALPSFAKKYIVQSGISIDEFLENADDLIANDTSVEENSQKIAKNISQNQIKPLAVKIISTIYSVLLIVVLLIVVKFLAVALNKAFSFSLAGKLNTALGGVCGLVKGLIFALLICITVYTVISFTENGIWIFTFENIDKTFIFKNLIGLIKI